MANTILQIIAVGIGITTVLLFVVIVRFHVYIKQSQLFYWELSVLVDIIFPLVTLLTLEVLKINRLSNVNIMNNIILLFDMIFWLLQFNQMKQTPKPYLLGVCLLFFIVWCGEFGLDIYRHGTENIDRLRITDIILHIIIVCGAWICLLDLFKKPFVDYLKMPFFWLIIGWLFFYITTSTTLFTGFLDPKKLPVMMMYDWASFSTLLTNILYIIAFWKTKDWVTRQRIA